MVIEPNLVLSILGFIQRLHTPLASAGPSTWYGRMRHPRIRRRQIEQRLIRLTALNGAPLYRDPK
jgi:hypothetical protein